MKPKRTKKRYTELFDNPALMFGSGIEVILFPNGRPEIWIQSKKPSEQAGLISGTYRITASRGKAGFGLQITNATGDQVITGSADGHGILPEKLHAYEHFGINARDAHDLWEYTWFDGVTHLEMCQYNTDEHSQAFKRWYYGKATEADLQLLGPGYHRSH